MGKRMKIGLALGGGGARGLAHIGVLKVLEENGIIPDIICGTSIGAVVGGKYAHIPSWRVVWEDVVRAIEGEAFKKAGMELFEEEEDERKNPFQEFLKVVEKGILYSRAIASTSLVSLKAYMEAVKDFFGRDFLIEETRIPFAAVATDLIKGAEVIITRGSMVKAVAASAAIPGIFPPIKWHDFLLVDGGWTEVLPATCARLLGADFVIGVWIGRDISEFSGVSNSFEVVSRADEITRHYLGVLRKSECDFIIEPDVGKFVWSEFDKKEEIFVRGEEAAEERIGELKKKLKQENLKKLFRSRKRKIPEHFKIEIAKPDFLKKEE